LVPTEVVAVTAPLALVERSALATPEMLRFVVLAVVEKSEVEVRAVELAYGKIDATVVDVATR
jgi:hypothetical protein